MSELSVLDVLSGYKQWAKNFPPRPHNTLMQIEEKAMLSLFPSDLSKKKCLDLACGSGRYILHLQDRAAKSIYGVDYSPYMLSQAKSYQLAFKLILGKFLTLPFAQGTFDFINCGLAIGHEKNLQWALREISRILKTGGQIVYSDLHPSCTLSGYMPVCKNDEGVYVKIEHYLHLYTDHHVFCEEAGLTIDRILEPLPSSSYPYFPIIIRAIKEK